MRTAKRFLLVFLVFALLLGSMAFDRLPNALTIEASGLRYDVLTYETNGREVTITGCDPSVSGFYAIPSEIDGLPVTQIGTDDGNASFYSCKKLTGIIIPDTVYRIGDEEFKGCSALRSISIPDRVEKIGWDAFYGTAYYNSSLNWKEGLLYIGNCLIRASNNGLIGMLDMNTRLIADGAFADCKNITSVSIPDSVEYIGQSAFHNCSSLTKITVSDHITDIGMSAFYGTGYYNNPANWEDGLLYLNCYLLCAVGKQVGNDCQIRYGTKQICAYAFGECDELTEIDLPDSVVRIGDWAFSAYHKGLTVLHFPNQLEWIGDHAFDCGLQNQDLFLPESVKHIGSGAFVNSEILQMVYVPKNVEYIGDAAFFSTSLLNIEVDPENSHYCDENGVLFTKDRIILMEYPHGRSDAYYYSFPNGVQYISPYAFLSCKQLQTVDIPSGVLQIGTNAFAYSGLTYVTVPDGVVKICNGAFEFCPLQMLHIPRSVKEIGDLAFTNCCFIVDEQNAVYSNDSYGALFNKNKTILYYYPKSNQETAYSVPHGVQEIEEYAFLNSSLKTIVLPNSLKKIGTSAFSYCRELQSITIPDSVQIIEDSAFSHCDSLKQAVLSSGITNIRSYTFSWCSNLQYVHIPSTITTIDGGAFWNCSPSLCSDADSAVIRAFAEKNSLEFHVCDGSNHKGISVYLMNKSLTVAYKSQTKLDVELKKAENCTVTWTTSDPQIATVDENGNVTAHRTGSVKIICTVTDKDGESFSDACDVHVQYTFWQWVIRILLFGFLWY